MKFTLIKCLTLFTICISTLFLSAQTYSEKYDLKLKYGDININENLEQFIASFSIENESTYDGHYFKYLQFFEIPSSSVRNAMHYGGIKFLDFIPDYAYVVAIPSGFDVNFFRNYNIRCISPILPDYKMSLDLLNKDYPDWSLRGNDDMDIIISYYSSVSINKVNLLKKGLVKEIIQEDQLAKTQIVRVHRDAINDIVLLPYVSYVEAVYPVPQPENYTGTSLHRTNVINCEYNSGRHYDGMGVNVMLQDDGIIGSW